MRKRDYLALCQAQTTHWLRQCAENPSAYMTATHVALIKIALRMRGELR